MKNYNGLHLPLTRSKRISWTKFHKERGVAFPHECVCELKKCHIVFLNEPAIGSTSSPSSYVVETFFGFLLSFFFGFFGVFFIFDWSLLKHVSLIFFSKVSWLYIYIYIVYKIELFWSMLLFFNRKWKCYHLTKKLLAFFSLYLSLTLTHARSLFFIVQSLFHYSWFVFVI